MLEADELNGSIAINGDRIVGIHPAGAAEPEARETIDVGEYAVMPGLVDSHAHFRDPGFTHKEDFICGTRAAALGGATTVMDMPNVRPATTNLEAFEAHIELASSKSIVDFGHNASAVDAEEIPKLASAGATAFKIFMMADVNRDYPHMPEIMVNDTGRLYELFSAVADTGKTLMVHPHDQSLWQKFVKDGIARAGTGPMSYAQAYSRDRGIVVNLGVAAAVELQAVTGVALHLLHTGNGRMLQIANNAKRIGQDVTVELNPHYLYLGTRENIERMGPYALGMWVPDAEGRHLWEALERGDIDIIATDHSPHAIEEKESGWENMFAAPGGSPLLQEYLSLLLTSVNQGRLTLRQVVDLCSTRPAKRFGLYPVKGVIREGADADLTVVDLERSVEFTDERAATKAGYTCYAGRRLTGGPVMTMVRGTVVAREGEVLVDPGFGEFVGARMLSRRHEVGDLAQA